MKKILSLVTISFLLVGCKTTDMTNFLVKPKVVDKPNLIIQTPRPVQSKNVEFVIITKENVEEVFNNLEKSGQDMVFFALTDDGYKALSLSVADMRRFVIQQNAVVKAYRDYYETKEEKTK